MVANQPGRQTANLRWWRNTLFSATSMALLTIPIQTALAGGKEDSHKGDWAVGGQDLNDWRNQNDTKISTKNAKNLKQKWVFTTGGDVSATPAVVNGVVYFPDAVGNFYALDAETGKVKWSHQISDWTGIPGDWSRNDPLVYDGVIYLGNQAGHNWTWDGTKTNGAGGRILAVDATTGTLKWVVQPEASPFLILTSAPIIYDGILYYGQTTSEEDISTAPTIGGNPPCCVSRGSVLALDPKTGKTIWRTYTIPDNGGKPGGWSGASIWDSTPVIDPKRNSIYVGTGDNFSSSAVYEACVKANPSGNSCSPPPDDHFDSALALDLKTGKIKWSFRALPFDSFNVGCPPITSPPSASCPQPYGPDLDFGGDGPHLLSVKTGGGREDDDHGSRRDILGIGSKSGIYWAFDPDNGHVVWKTQVGPGGLTGGIEWGTATDGERIYVPVSNSYSIPFSLQPSGVKANGGSWAALDPATGKHLWQTSVPGNCSPVVTGYAQGCQALGPASVAGGVVFVGSMDPNPANPTFFALDGKTGAILWSYVAGASVVAAPAIVGNSVYWGSGYSLGPNAGLDGNKFFAFSID